jgi:CelD/BcsL family acetyltransferase involved in cellulose biosynthesis
VHLSRLDVGTTWAATNLALLHGDCYYHVLASYDDGEVSRFGPGAAHLRELLRYAIARGCARFDFTIGDEALQARLVRDRAAAARLCGRGHTARLAVVRDRVRLRRAKRMIKQSTLLWGVAVRLRAAVAAMRSKPAPTAQEPAD